MAQLEEKLLARYRALEASGVVFDEEMGLQLLQAEMLLFDGEEEHQDQHGVSPLKVMRQIVKMHDTGQGQYGEIPYLGVTKAKAQWRTKGYGFEPQFAPREPLALPEQWSTPCDTSKVSSLDVFACGYGFALWPFAELFRQAVSSSPLPPEVLRARFLEVSMLVSLTQFTAGSQVADLAAELLRDVAPAEAAATFEVLAKRRWAIQRRVPKATSESEAAQQVIRYLRRTARRHRNGGEFPKSTRSRWARAGLSFAPEDQGAVRLQMQRNMRHENDAGRSISEVARALGRPRSSIRNHLDEAERRCGTSRVTIGTNVYIPPALARELHAVLSSKQKRKRRAKLT